MLYRKIDAQEQRKVFFRRTVDGFIKGNDAGGVFRNEHSPDACAQLCLDDINCVSFDAGRQYALKWDGADVSRGKEWQPHIDNCYLSYTTKDAVTKDRWEEPNCDKQTNPNPPFDPDCSNDDANGIDYYERIIPMFVEFDVEWSKLVNPQYFTWGKVNEFGEKKTFYTPLMNRPATTGDDGDDYDGGYYNYDDDGYSNDGAPGGGDDGAPGGNDDGGGDDDDDADYDGDAPDDYFTALFYDDPRQYRSESRPPRKDLKATILERYPHVGTRDAMAKQVVAWVMEAVKANGGDTDVEMACNIEVGKNGKTIAQINTGSDKNDGILKDNLASISFSCPEGWDACTYDDSSAVAAKIIPAADMKCAAGTASTSGFGQGDSCVPCGLDRYPNGPQTDCRLCPQGTTTKVGARVKGALAKKGERQCIVAPDQSQAKLGSFRVGYEWHGTFASPLGAAGNGRWAQGDYKMRVTSATVNEDNKIVMEVFVEARHGEDCDRSRSFGNACICEGGARCACYTDPNRDGDLSDAVANTKVIAGNQCSNSDCSCRDPGLTSYYLSGTADSTTIDLMRVSRFSGITDRNDWLFVARGFKGKISIEKGNTVINGLFATPTEQPGNSVGPPLIPKLNVDRTSDYKKCDEAKFDHCGKTGYVKLTERCYAAVEVGTFNVGDTFVGSQQCYRPGTNMRVTGLNKRPEENVRKMDVTVTNVETSDDDDALVTVTAEITVTFGVDGNPEDQGEGRYLASGEYNPTTGGIELIPNAAAWLTSHPRNIPARMIKGGLTQEGELVVGTILPNPKCECKDICDGRGDEPKCRVGKDCAEGQQNAFGDDDDDTNYYAPCDEATDFGEEAKGFYEECTSFNLARVCQAPTPVCEIGWTLIDESERCYKFMDDQMTYADAKDACEAVDAQLASIHGQAENTKVGDMAKSFDLKDDDFFWIGLTVKSKLPAWIDGTPFTYTGHTRERTLRPKGPCGAYKIGGSNLWQTDQIPDSDGSCDDTTLPFVCKKPPAGQLSPCSCSGVSDEDHFGGSCKSWTPGEKAWSTPWCYVAKNCERAVKQENGRFKATCVDPNAAPKTTTAAVSTKFSGDAQCNAGKFQKDANTCVDCKTCSDGKVPSSNFGDRCGAINPKNQKPQPAFKDHDFTCCTPYFTKVAECAKDSKGASPFTSCRGGKDFTCQECPAGTYYPVRKDCQNADFVAKNSKLCRCLPCDVVCATCSRYPGQCTSCSDNLFLKKTARSSTCTSVCDGRADAGAKRLFYAANETASCEKCTTAENCPKTTISAKCSATADTRFEGECSTSTMTSTTTVTTKTATQTTVTSTTKTTKTDTSTTATSTTATETTTLTTNTRTTTSKTSTTRSTTTETKTTTSKSTTTTTTTTTITTTTTTLNSEALCARFGKDNGECDYDSVVKFIAEANGYGNEDSRDYNVKVVCQMIRLGFSLADTFDAKFDELDCDKAEKETSRNEICYDVKDTFEDNACLTAAPLASIGGNKSAGGGSTTVIIAIVAVIVVLGIGAAAFMLTRNKGSSGAKAGVTSFENPMYDTSFQTSGGGGGAGAGGSGQTSGYMDVDGSAPTAEGGQGYMDVQPTPAEGAYDNMGAPEANANSGYMDVSGEANANSGYMDVAGGGQYIEDDDEEDV